MGIYSHLTTEQLTAKRDKLLQALEDRLTQPTAAGSASRNAQYNQRIEDIERQLRALNEELAERAGSVTRGPIYIV